MRFRHPDVGGTARIAAAAAPEEAPDTTHAAALRTTAGERGTRSSRETSGQSLDMVPRVPSGAPAAVDSAPGSASPGRCLDALIVALTQSGDGKAWYTSTTQLQLASLDLCVACRAVPTLHLIIDGGMPDRLRASGGGAAAAAVASRVPAFRPRGVTWNLPLSALRGQEDEVFAEVRVLVLGHGLGRVSKGLSRWVDGRVSLPPALRELTFGQWYNRPVHGVAWPSRLEKLTFGEGFNQPIDRVSWPPSLRRLTFGLYFDQPIRGASWPASLRELRFGHYFNQPIDRVVWPASLERLTFGLKFNQPIGEVAWPSSLRELTLSRDFAQPIDDVEWPSSMEHLTIAGPVGAPLPSWPDVEVHAVWRDWWG
ncbi:unnamed protein product [Scytosiphon promiscuus]